MPGPPLDNGLDWYLAPVVEIVEDITTDPDNPIFGYKGPASAGVPYEPGHRMVMHAYDDVNDEVLVGVPPGTAVPGDWTAQTLGQATSQFTTVKGRAPTAKEIR
jgi:hypothetical protein